MRRKILVGLTGSLAMISYGILSLRLVSLYIVIPLTIGLIAVIADSRLKEVIKKYGAPDKEDKRKRSNKR